MSRYYEAAPVAAVSGDIAAVQPVVVCVRFRVLTNCNLSLF